MNGQELIDWLLRLPKEALQKPIKHVVATFDGDDMFEEPVEIEDVDYDLRMVTLR